MEYIMSIFDLLLHIDKQLVDFSIQYGIWIYSILFFIIFAETGFVVTPFLPGDSLLFAVGALSGGALVGGVPPHLFVVLFVMIFAAFTGNLVNYYIGKTIGGRILENDSKLIKREYIDQTRTFYEKHGVKAIVIGRFLPIIRTFVPFVAGIAKMDSKLFISWTFLSALVWVVPITLLGYFFGGLEIVQKNFSMVVIAIILISIIPTVFTVLKEKFRN